jgi:hypothetical protein
VDFRNGRKHSSLSGDGSGFLGKKNMVGLLKSGNVAWKKRWNGGEKKIVLFWR